MSNSKIKSFTDLIVWKEGHKLVLMVYRITDEFPKAETYSMIDQMRRAATSITANITEGFGRQGYKEKLQFYYLAQGSLTELKNFILIAKDVGYFSQVNFNSIVDQSNHVHKLLQGFIAKTKTFLIPKS